MRVLRFGNSDDTNEGVPESARAWFVAQQCLAEACGEPVETALKAIWPGRELPGLVDEWLDRHDPDLVFLKITWYWYAYESVPLRIERLLGPILGKRIANASLKAAERPRLAQNRLFKLGRRAAHRLIGGDTPFDSRQVMEVMEACVRRVVAREGVLLVVKGTGDGRRADGPLAGYFDRFTRRRIEVEGTIERLCGELHVPYVGTGRRKTDEEKDLGGGDGVHRGARGQRNVGLQEGEALVAAYMAARQVV
jgi:hypothetical protein